ncbi:NAD(P)-dependent iron-only hydrogenase diaphorase component flavoprotein [Clostridium sp. USBA 49]|uniref:NADH-quinone oxidoreductase subunit NuoF n=1 Tax=Clostridium sp. USBA 49 TaxID=1881060 RepID=UPI0009998B22|nr:NADH-quinone oxidoreductase subunit NuoF [Clostridium sp. USBA 49]SKA90222.1 NAD(P)-dependent iron-only hydrogenase diaphorase component flavoprotein [Clostridium sp. USBA 49]
MDFYRAQVLVCGGSGCSDPHCVNLFKVLKTELKRHNLDHEIEVVKTACLGLCELGPVVIVYPEGTFYSKVKAEDIPELVEEHFINNKVLERLIYRADGDGRVKNLNELSFFKKQVRIALRNCGIIDPENINEYIALDGYGALIKVLTSMTPNEVIDTIKQSGLRGRGGGGFPTGNKWEFAAVQQSPEKYIICNADEGDPGAFMDRSVLEGDPHSVLEAMTIGGYAIGANKGFVYVRAEYPVAVERLRTAIEQSRNYGLLGDNILGTGFNFDIEIRLGAGAFVCGEETALMQSIEGKRGMPMPKPPFPAVRGLWSKPTVINNVETFANIVPIILKGAEWFRSIGTEKSPGTKVFALGGKIRNTGLVEIPMGTTLRETIYEIGGGIPNAKEFKAVQTGGPSGGCISAEYLDTPIEYDTLTALGSMMGSGGMIVMDEDNCMVDVARFFLDFTKDESCGKCTPCRIGTKRLLEILEKITQGNGTLEDIELLEKLGKGIKNVALCGLGQTAPNPVLSTLHYFKDEYIAHVTDKKCPAKVCKPLVKYVILEDKCKGCGLCTRNCSAGAISGKVKEVHVIDSEICVRCGLCMSICKFKAIIKV